MMSLNRLNETAKGAMVVDNLVIFPERIVIDSNVLFECSCVCLSDVIVHGTLSAQYDLRILGRVQADMISVSGKFECSNDLSCNVLEVGKDCSINGSLSAKRINVRGTLICDELGSDEIAIRDQAIIRSTADVTGDVSVERTLICLDGITADGCVSAENIIAGEYADLDGKAIILSELDDAGQERQKRTVSELSKPFSIASEDPETIKDYTSPLATVLDDVAAFIENCQSLFPRDTLESELDVLKSLASFLPSFASLHDSISAAASISIGKEISDWYEGFLMLSDAYINLPEWLYTSKCNELLHTGLLQYLSSYRTNSYSVRSRTVWARSLNALMLLKTCDRLPKELGDHVDICLSMIYAKIGIKSRVVKMYLPEV